MYDNFNVKYRILSKQPSVSRHDRIPIINGMYSTFAIIADEDKMYHIPYKIFTYTGIDLWAETTQTTISLDP